MACSVIIARYDGARSRLKLGNSLRRLQTIRRTFENLARKRGGACVRLDIRDALRAVLRQRCGDDVVISVFGIVLSIVVGLICAGIEIARIPVLKQIVRVYIELSRNTPLLVQLYFLYFGLPKLGVVWSAEQCAIVGLGFLGGSYMAEAMRGGLETIPNVQRESAYVLGLSQWQTLSRVVIPQAIGTSIPGIVANVIFLIKESSVVSAIALADVMYMAKDLIGMYYSTYESLLMLVVAYLVILLPISLFGTWLERRFDYERR